MYLSLIIDFSCFFFQYFERNKRCDNDIHIVSYLNILSPTFLIVDEDVIVKFSIFFIPSLYHFLMYFRIF